ncbi:MAG: hypothetical protein DLM67_12025 [Candidatus Nephthysia bennettiae]|nr:MAG: hypothetical protein DLM67_12025 [Candidatus Dormibacteraeota bacterium]PZS09134.1 MAG: hypothetical protein DLM70_01915 [Chloroflexota bacterium]
MLPNTPNAHLVSNGLRPINCFTPAFHANVLLEGFLSDTPIHIGELLPAVAMSLDLERAADRKIRVDSSKYAVLENNLTRKGIWATDGGRRPKPTETVHQEVLTFETEDIVGRLVMESSLGQLTVFEMELVSWIMAKWVQKEVPESPTVEFFEAELAREFGVQWGGSRAKFQKEALRKLDRVRFTAEVWSEKTKTLVTEHFGIFDRITIVERKNSRTGPAIRPVPIRARFGEFIHEQLKAGQYRRYSWQVLRGALKTPLAKRLYVLLDGQKGRETHQGWLYEHTVDEKLLSSLGVRDRNMSRVRTSLRAACDEIRTAEPQRYLRCEVREGARSWVLSALKKP